MNALKYILPIYFVLFLFYGIKKPKEFLLLTGIVTLPLETTYSFVYDGPRDGWVSGIQISLSEVSFVLLFCYLIVKKYQFRVSSGIILPLMAFIMACGLSLINSTAGMTTVYQVVMLIVTSFLYYFTFSNSIQTEKDVRNVLSFFLIALIFQGCISVLQYCTGSILNLFSTGSMHYRDALMTVGDNDQIYRVFGTAPHPNTFAAYLVPLIIMNMSLLVMVRKKDYLRIFGVILGVVTLIFTFSRGGWLSFIVATVLFMIVATRQRLLEYRKAALIVTTGICLVLIFFPFIQERIYGDDHNAAMSRIPLITLAFNMIKEHPVIGVGANTYSNVIPSYVTYNLEDAYVDQVHNQYLLIFAETGFIGLAAFVWLLISMVRENIPCIRQNKNILLKYVGLGCALSIAATSMHMMTDLFNSRLLLGSVFILGGLSTAIHRILLNKKLNPV